MNVPHPEQFLRQGGSKSIGRKRALAVSQRIIDYAMVLVYGDPHLLTFMSTTNHLRATSCGVIISKEAFDAFDKTTGNDTLSHYFRVPMFTVMHPFYQFLKTHKDLRDKKNDIYEARRNADIPPRDAIASWESRQLQDVYGPYAVTYALMAEKCIAAGRVHVARRNKTPDWYATVARTAQERRAKKSLGTTGRLPKPRVPRCVNCREQTALES